MQSPFHKGEQLLQARNGRRDEVEALGQRVIRDHMPAQHQRFYEGLQFLVVGSVDDERRPWATLLSGGPGFITALDDQTLHIKARPDSLDRVHDGVAANQSIALLGIDLATRRRNRLNGVVVSANADSFTVFVHQTFGNCPQYVHKRIYQARQVTNASASAFSTLDSGTAEFIRAADTFFVASYVAEKSESSSGVDVSHRGGRPGFVHVEENVLTIPDFRGNGHFNTLGNFVLNPKAGLVFPDFSSGRLLQLTGSVRLLDESPRYLAGAERAWQVSIESGQWLQDAMPLHFGEPEWSPQTLTTGVWS